jgi:hypothetical protein
MPMYYFHLRDNEPILDKDGTELIDMVAAEDHAQIVARELTFKTDGILGEVWSMWSMHVEDADGTELFSFPMGDVKSDPAIKAGNGK